MSDNKNPNPQKKEIKMILPEKLRTGVYSNAASVTLSKKEVVVDFGYVIPNTNPMTLEIVSRVNMSFDSAKSFLSTFQNAILDYENKMK